MIKQANLRDQELDEILSLETASFKRKIRKPLKFGTSWQIGAQRGKALNTLTGNQNRLFELQLPTDNDLTIQNLRGIKGQRLDSTKSCALEQSKTLLNEAEIDAKHYGESRLPGTRRQDRLVSNASQGGWSAHTTGDNNMKPTQDRNGESVSDDSCFKVPKSIVKGPQKMMG